MLDQFKPPTDSLYKFVALSGLALLLASGWAHLRIDLELFKLDREADLIIQVMQKEDHAHAAAELDKYADEIEKADKVERDEILERVKSIWFSHPPTYTDRIRELAENFSARGKLVWKNHPERILLKVAMFGGALLTVCGFGLWYFKVQRPLDEILQAQVQEARAKRLSSDTNSPT